MKINFVHKGNFKNLEKFLVKCVRFRPLTDKILTKYAIKGVEMLRAMTPRDTGLTANSWTYEITHDSKYGSIVWRNTNVQNGNVVALLIQYGHGTKTGAWVEGRDYINPAIESVFNGMADELWKEVTS